MGGVAEVARLQKAISWRGWDLSSGVASWIRKLEKRAGRNLVGINIQGQRCLKYPA